jgi:hypothetical protein
MLVHRLWRCPFDVGRSAHKLVRLAIACLLLVPNLLQAGSPGDTPNFGPSEDPARFGYHAGRWRGAGGTGSAANAVGAVDRAKPSRVIAGPAPQEPVRPVVQTIAPSKALIGTAKKPPVDREPGVATGDLSKSHVEIMEQRPANHPRDKTPVPAAQLAVTARPEPPPLQSLMHPGFQRPDAMPSPSELRRPEPVLAAQPTPSVPASPVGPQAEQIVLAPRSYRTPALITSAPVQPPVSVPAVVERVDPRASAITEPLPSPSTEVQRVEFKAPLAPTPAAAAPKIVVMPAAEVQVPVVSEPPRGTVIHVPSVNQRPTNDQQMIDPFRPNRASAPAGTVDPFRPNAQPGTTPLVDPFRPQEVRHGVNEREAQPFRRGLSGMIR